MSAEFSERGCVWLTRKKPRRQKSPRSRHHSRGRTTRAGGPLFDGKTLTNWKSTEFGGEGEVYVQDGVLGYDMGNPLTGITWTGAKLPTVNYEVRFEARKVRGGDFFCALTFPVQDNYQTLVLGGWGGAVIGLSSINGYDASENETTDYYTFKKEQWYKVHVKVTDKTIQSWIDGESINEVEYAGKRLSTRIEVDPSKPFGVCSFETQGRDPQPPAAFA